MEYILGWIPKLLVSLTLTLIELVLVIVCWFFDLITNIIFSIIDLGDDNGPSAIMMNLFFNGSNSSSTSSIDYATLTTAFKDISMIFIFLFAAYCLFKLLFAPIDDSDETAVSILTRSAVALVMCKFSKQLMNYLKEIITAPIDGVTNLFDNPNDSVGYFSTMGQDLIKNIDSFSGLSLESWNSIDVLSVLLDLFNEISLLAFCGLLVIGIIMIGKKYLTLALEIIRRLVILTVLFMAFPLATISFVSKSSSRILSSYVKMILSEGIFLFLNCIFVRVSLTGLSNIASVSAGEEIIITDLVINAVLVYGMISMCCDIDKIINKLGLLATNMGNLGRETGYAVVSLSRSGLAGPRSHSSASHSGAGSRSHSSASHSGAGPLAPRSTNMQKSGKLGFFGSGKEGINPSRNGSASAATIQAQKQLAGILNGTPDKKTQGALGSSETQKQMVKDALPELSKNGNRITGVSLNPEKGTAAITTTNDMTGRETLHTLSSKASGGKPFKNEHIGGYSFCHTETPSRDKYTPDIQPDYSNDLKVNDSHKPDFELKYGLGNGEITAMPDGKGHVLLSDSDGKLKVSLDEFNTLNGSNYNSLEPSCLSFSENDCITLQDTVSRYTGESVKLSGAGDGSSLEYIPTKEPGVMTFNDKVSGQTFALVSDKVASPVDDSIRTVKSGRENFYVCPVESASTNSSDMNFRTKNAESFRAVGVRHGSAKHDINNRKKK